MKKNNSLSTKEEKIAAFSRLLDIMDDLREKCPWDRKQTFQSLKPLTIEELYELTDAIGEENYEEIKKEIGDVLLHLVFYSKLGEEKREFDIASVIHSLNEKLIYRHPHIYGDTEVKDEEEVKKNWEKLKLKEGNTSVLSGVPYALPALLKAYRIQDKVKGVGFEFENENQTWDKVKEEIAEFEQETEDEKREQEFGDVLFSLVNYARFTGINPEIALEKTNKKFIQRFQELEKLAKEKGKNLSDMTLSEMDALWKIAKKEEQNRPS